ncbi:unnamed protein product [Spodoptera exigua]|nr:unnamed protein product [Spodoptera exigua]
MKDEIDGGLILMPLLHVVIQNQQHWSDVSDEADAAEEDLTASISKEASIRRQKERNVRNPLQATADAEDTLGIGDPSSGGTTTAEIY